jgi:hypothetical protein
MTTCTQAQAIELAVACESIAPRFGFHTALTGGCLYKGGERKDIDILFYEHSNAPKHDKAGLLDALEAELKFFIGYDYGRVVKSIHSGRVVDLLFPGYEGEYHEDENVRALIP